MKATSAEVGEAIDRVQQTLAEAEQAKREHDEWLLAWRQRNGIPLRRSNEDAA